MATNKFNGFDRLEEGAIDEIDAALFTGDTFLNRDHIRRMRDYLARWEQGLQEMESILDSNKVPR